MLAKRRNLYPGLFLVAALVFVAGGARAHQSTGLSQEQKDDAAGLSAEFSRRVQDYIKLQKAVESKLPALKSMPIYRK